MPLWTCVCVGNGIKTLYVVVSFRGNPLSRGSSEMYLPLFSHVLSSLVPFVHCLLCFYAFCDCLCDYFWCILLCLLHFVNLSVSFYVFLLLLIFLLSHCLRPLVCSRQWVVCSLLHVDTVAPPALAIIGCLASSLYTHTLTHTHIHTQEREHQTQR